MLTARCRGRWSTSDGIPKPTPATSPSAASRASATAPTTVSRTAASSRAAGAAQGPVVDVEARIDDAGQQLRAAQVDPDHAAGGHGAATIDRLR